MKSPKLLQAFLAIVAYVLMVNGIGHMFALAFMGVLAIKELGQWQASKHHNIKYELPYLLPFPYPFGCLGSFTMVKEFNENKAANIDVYSRGLFYCFAASVLLMMVGLNLSNLTPAVTDIYQFTWGQNMIAKVMHALFGFELSTTQILNYHPIYLAGLAGTFTCALSLLPIGQLNGGYLMLSTLGKPYVWVSMAVTAGLFVLGVSQHYAWLLILSVYLLFTYGHHDANLTEGTIGKKQKIQIALSITIFVLGMMTSPYLFS